MNLEAILYQNYEEGLPQTGNVIFGQKRGDSVIVYQAFNDSIADFAIKNQKFGGNAYSFSRMTWIKPNFLWMMYRSGWAEKPDQNRILAIEMSLSGFEDLLIKGVYSSFNSQVYESHEAWKTALRESDVRLQWDPDHGPKGGELDRRAVQIGFKGEALRTFNKEYIRSITDITDFVKAQKANLDARAPDFYVMHECIIHLDKKLNEKFSIPHTFIQSSIEELILQFEQNNKIDDSEFERIWTEGDLRPDFISYIRNYSNPSFSRYLLRKGIDSRKKKEGIACEDLLLLCYFVSKNRSENDIELIMEIKPIDFDTYCGFDGNSVFLPLGYEPTIKFLQENVHRFGKDKVEFFSGFVIDEFENGIKSPPFWYLY